MKPKDRRISDDAVHNATGRRWDEWFTLLEEEGAAEMPHPDIVRLLMDRGHIEDGNGWWAQAVTVEYEYHLGRRTLGQTSNAGFEIGVQKTLPVTVDEAWALVVGAGRGVWLGAEMPDLEFDAGSTASAEGYQVEIRTIRDRERIRLRWQPPGRPEPTVLQLHFGDKGDRTALRVHQEKLSNPDERERMKEHWRGVLGRLKVLADG